MEISKTLAEPKTTKPTTLFDQLTGPEDPAESQKHSPVLMLCHCPPGTTGAVWAGQQTHGQRWSG